jgi:hypothetical protein
VACGEAGPQAGGVRGRDAVACRGARRAAGLGRVPGRAASQDTGRGVGGPRLGGEPARRGRAGYEAARRCAARRDRLPRSHRGPARPAFLDQRDDAWSYGDHIAWDELPVQACPAALELLQPLIRARHPVTLAPQVVHGDLLGNVLFSDSLPPAIIDWPAYWRPASWAYAVAVADALCWYQAQPQLAARWSHLPSWGQMLVRALIYRIATDEAALGPAGWTPAHAAAYRPVIDLAIKYAGNTPH